MTPEPNVDTLLARADHLSRTGREPEAIDAYQRALQQRPELADGWYNLARLLSRARRYDDALVSYQHALDLCADQPEEVHLNRAVILAENLANPDGAEQELRAALMLNPRYVPAMLNLGNLFEHRGDERLATAQYEAALAIDPHNALALARLSTITPLTDIGDPLILRLKQAIARPGVVAAEHADLGFSLGAALDKVAAYDEAFAAYAAANAASRRIAHPRTVRYDRSAHEQSIERLIEAFPHAQDRTEPPTADTPQLIFICGMFRSGSTLVERVLASHSRVTAGGELDLLPALVKEHLPTLHGSGTRIEPTVIEHLRARYLTAAGALHPNATILTDKRPDNFLHIGLIKAMFPHAKIVHTRRHPIDNCLAVFFLHLSHSMPYALDLADTAHWYGQYRRLMVHWKTLYSDDIHDVDYDALVEAPQPSIERLLASAGLPWEDTCLHFHEVPSLVKTASAWQVRQPLYTRSSGRWKHYAPHLEALVAELRHQLGDQLV